MLSRFAALLFDLRAKRRLRSYRDFLSVGDGTYGLEHVQIHRWKSGGRVTIGNYCSLADNIHIFLGGNHRSDWVSQYPFSDRVAIVQGRPRGERAECETSKGDVVIGSDVWIGSGAYVMSGVHIGDGAVVAARATVTSNVEPYDIVVGSPARSIGSRFPSQVVDVLLDLAWWDWPPEDILNSVDLLCSPPSGHVLAELEIVATERVSKGDN